MTRLHKHPILYEINTIAWLNDLSRQAGRQVTLASVPPEAWDAIAAWKVDAVWLMGVWERSPQGVQIALQDGGLVAEFHRALPDFRPGDVAGSPYCVRRYVVDRRFDGKSGLAVARKELAGRGIALVLDFVPNHLASDHPWVEEHPDYFILGDEIDLRRAPGEFLKVGRSVIAQGRDPYFPPWHDVLQLNAFHPGLRKSSIAALDSIAGQCDGVRCDMAMLLLTEVFAQTWGARAGALPADEYWSEVIPAIKMKHPGFVFIAEAYWDKEWELQQLGFDYCYDKRMYDRLVQEDGRAVRGHLGADKEYQAGLVRFIENHDEPRAAVAFTPEQGRAAAVTVASQMGMRLFHEGQFEGRKLRQPIALARRPVEPLDADLQKFYQRLLKALHSDVLRQGDWRLCDCRGWPDNSSYLNLVAWSWFKADRFVVVVVNLSEVPSQGRVQLPWDGIAGRSWLLNDLLGSEQYEREGDEMHGPGLYVALPAWGMHFFLSR